MQNGYSVTGMYYHQIWTNTTDIPVRAITEDIVPDRFGSLDPTDGGDAERASLSVQYDASLGGGGLSTNGFFIYNELHLFNNFTHYLTDPVHGDQEDQFENRKATGGTANYTLPVPLGSIQNEIAAGMLTRYDLLAVGVARIRFRCPMAPIPLHFLTMIRFTCLRAPLTFKPPPSGAHNFEVCWDSARIISVVPTSTTWRHCTRTAGYTNAGTAKQALFQPKGSLIYTASDSLEFYLSAGRGFHSADLRGLNQDVSVDLGLPNTHLLSKQEGQELGVRAAVGRDLTFTFAVYNLWQQSETIVDPDVGADSAGPPSRRYGYEINVTYQITPWLEFYGSYSGDHTRFTRPFDDGTGHLGTYITDAPFATGSLALYVTNLGPWSGGIDYRYLGNYPLSSGPCVNSAAVHDFPGATSCANAPTALGQVNGQGFGQMNLDVRYALPAGWSASMGIYNLLNTHASAAQFWYVDRLQNEIGTYPDGRPDVHVHPLEPLMVRFTVTKKFGH